MQVTARKGPRPCDLIPWSLTTRECAALVQKTHPNPTGTRDSERETSPTTTSAQAPPCPTGGTQSTPLRPRRPPALLPRPKSPSDRNQQHPVRKPAQPNTRLRNRLSAIWYVSRESSVSADSAGDGGVAWGFRSASPRHRCLNCPRWRRCTFRTPGRSAPLVRTTDERDAQWEGCCSSGGRGQKTTTMSWEFSKGNKSRRDEDEQWAGERRPRSDRRYPGSPLSEFPTELRWAADPLPRGCL